MAGVRRRSRPPPIRRRPSRPREGRGGGPARPKGMKVGQRVVTGMVPASSFAFSDAPGSSETVR
jgi:hypothetical protein